MSIRVLIAEDFPIVRDALATALDRDPAIEVIGTAGGGEEALSLARQLVPDVMVVDLHMPGLGGIGLLERLSGELPDVRSMVLTASEKSETLLAAISAGARGYLTKRTKAEALRQAVFTVHGGGSVIEPGLTNHLLDAVSRGAVHGEDGLRPKLTATELEVLRLLTEGLTDREIAQQLFVSPRTVQNHLARVREKTNTRRRSELARWAVVHAVY
jgi:DNA-binding NarL/FixJ family response regulator